MDLEALRLAEAFFARKPEALPSVRAFLLGVLERWPETEIVTQKSQVGLRDPRPYCALTAPGKRVKGRAAPGAMLSLFLPADPEDFGESLWSWIAEARRFRCGKE